MQRIGDKTIKVTLSDEDFERVQKIARRHDLKLAQVVRNMMFLGLDVYGDLEITGAVKAVELYNKGKKWLQRARESRQLRLI